MSSEYRLHPLSFLFAIGGHLRQMLLPALAVLFTASSRGGNWELWIAWALLPIALFSAIRALSYRYRFDPTELVIHTGFIFRNERKIPYARIQNIEAIQNVAHRALSLVEVRIETGSGREDDATMRVVPMQAYAEIRERVLAGRAAATGTAPVAEVERPAGPPVLALPARELLLSGIIDNRSAVVIAAALGAVWELGFGDYLLDLVFEDRASRRSFARQVVRALFGGAWPGPQTILLGIGGLALLFALVTALSMTWAWVRLHGFVLRRVQDDLRTEYGLLTRVATTIPLRRVQTLTIYQSPLHRFFGRASVKVETAGGDATQAGTAGREPLAPIIRAVDLPALLAHVLPEIDIARVDWRPAAPRAARREFWGGAVVAVLVSLLFVVMLRIATLVLLACFLGIAALHAWRYTATLGWAATDGAVFFRRGWLWRRITIARSSKVQVVALHRSPFDRRHRMARLRVDTAGAASQADRIVIPYLPADAASALQHDLATAASGTEFQW